MSQGKKYTKEDREVIIESLKSYLQLGYSRSKACKFIGFDESTLSKWSVASESLSMRLTGWENETSVLARKNLRSDIEKRGNTDTSLKWLQAKDRQEFGKNLDVTSDHKPISKIEVVYKKFGDEESTDANNT